MTQAVLDPGARGLPRLRVSYWRNTRATGVVLVLALLALWEASARFGFVQSTNWPPFGAVTGVTMETLQPNS